MAIDRETGPRPRTEDDVIRMERARQLWDEALDPRGPLSINISGRARLTSENLLPFF